MLSRAHRFHGHRSLNWAYKNGKTVRDPMMSLRYALNPRRKTYRVAIVVGRKVNKSAVKRNRIRRRVYGAIDTQADLIRKNYDLIFSVFSDDLATMPSAEVSSLIKKLLKQLDY